MRRNRPKRVRMDPRSHARLRRRWRSWLPAMNADLAHLLGKREIFWDLQKIAKENRRILDHGAFFDWMCTNYIAAVTIGVRSFTDQSKNVHSLWKLLYEALETPGVFSRRAHQALYRHMAALPGFAPANRTFDSIAGPGRKVLSQNQIRGDIRALEDSTARVRRFVNKRIAHRTSPGQLRRLPRFNQLDDAMETIDRIFCRYYLLLTARGLQSAFATRQYDWMEALHEAWVPPGSKFRPET